MLAVITKDNPTVVAITAIMRSPSRPPALRVRVTAAEAARLPPPTDQAGRLDVAVLGLDPRKAFAALDIQAGLPCPALKRMAGIFSLILPGMA